MAGSNQSWEDGDYKVVFHGKVHMFAKIVGQNVEFLDDEGQEENNLNAVCSLIQFETKIKRTWIQ